METLMRKAQKLTLWVEFPRLGSLPVGLVVIGATKLS